MSYLVLECHPGYAVVLDEEGRILKTANMHYEVGQRVTEIIEMQVPGTFIRRKKWWYYPAVTAACLMLAVMPTYRLIQTPIAAVYITINPAVRIDVNRFDRVIDLTGVNEDGDDLIYGYQYEKKELEVVMEELIQRAIDMGYLHAGGKVTLKLDTEDDRWIVEHHDDLEHYLEVLLEEKISVTVDIPRQLVEEVTAPVEDEPQDVPQQQEIPEPQEVPQQQEIPEPQEVPQQQETPIPQEMPSIEVPTEPSAESNNGGYGDTDYGANNDGVTDYDDDDDRDDDDDDNDEDGQTDYDED